MAENKKKNTDCEKNQRGFSGNNSGLNRYVLPFKAADPFHCHPGACYLLGVVPARADISNAP